MLSCCSTDKIPAQLSSCNLSESASDGKIIINGIEPGASTVSAGYGSAGEPSASLAGCNTCPTFVQPSMQDILTDIQSALETGSTVVNEAGSSLGRSLGASLGQAVTTATEQNPQAAKAIVASGAAIGVGVVLAVGLLGYLIGKNV